MKNLKKFDELSEGLDAHFATHSKRTPRKTNDAEDNSNKIDEILNVITSSMDAEDDDEMSTKASVLVVYMNLKLSEKDREAIKKNI